jgi:arylsulfatase
VSSNALPPPAPKFGGQINRTAAESKPWWPPRVVPPKGAPNVLLILLDDAGYAAQSTFGGTIPTPSMDKLAREGLRYTHFHSSALCSPTRAALITGRNPHSVAFGIVAEGATGFPGYDSIVKKDTATIGTILRDNGYGTSWFGKNHNVSGWLHTQAGPFDQWPVGMGFEFFYGFLGGDSSQWQPNLTRNTTLIAPYEGNPGWNLITAMADEAVDYMHRLNAIAPDKPFLVYYAPGATHAAPPDEGVGREVQGQVRPRLERGARADLRQPEAPRRDPAEREADRVAGQRAEVGHVQQGRAEDARPPGRGLRRLHGLRRPRGRARDPGGRGPR